MKQNLNLTIRINSIQSGDLFNEDIKHIFDAPFKPKCVFVPKTDDFDQIRILYEAISAKLTHNDRIDLFFYMESAISLLNLQNIVDNSIKISNEKYNSKFCLKGVVFGSDDYCADIGCARSEDSLLYARQHMVTVCKAYRLNPIDMVYIDYKGIYTAPISIYDILVCSVKYARCTLIIENSRTQIYERR